MASKSLKLSNYLRFFCNFNFKPLTHQLFPSLNSTRGKSSIGLRQYTPELVRSFSAATFNHGNSSQRKGREPPHYLDESQVLFLKIFIFLIWAWAFAVLDQMGIVE